MKNPIKKFREEKRMNRRQFALEVGSNHLYITNAETKGVLVPEQLVRKIGLVFDDVNEGQLLNDYKGWQKEFSS